MRKKKFNIGDIYCVDLDDNTKKYFQYVANDISQLNSDVIRVFKKAYLKTETPRLEDVISDDVAFYTHVVLEFGITLKKWEKVGNISDVGKVDLLFRDSQDYGNPQIKVSNDWWVWRTNEDPKRVGRLTGDNRNAEIGIVVTPLDIVERMRTGKYDFVYPEFE